MGRVMLAPLWIDDEQAEGLKLIKHRDGLQESEQIRRAIDDGLESRMVPQTLREYLEGAKQLGFSHEQAYELVRPKNRSGLVGISRKSYAAAWRKLQKKADTSEGSQA